jgi:hypothetical protein
MRKQSWFDRNTLPIRTFQYHECRAYGRNYCYGCCLEVEYPERVQPFEPDARPPVWKKRYLKTVVLSPTEVRFLQGLPEYRPTFRPKPTFQRRWRQA